MGRSCLSGDVRARSAFEKPLLYRLGRRVRAWEFRAMAQRSSGFARKPAADVIAATATLARAMDEDEGPGAVALELAPLIAPYRKHGRLSLRVERLPPRARLSHGHNNGDRSWSLRSDELDGLSYLPPKGAAPNCTLSIRVVSLDGGTLALLDYAVGDETAAQPSTA